MKPIRWLPVFLWLGIICYLSFSDLEKLPVPQFFSADKIAHFSMYFLLEFLLLFALKNNYKKLGLFTIIAVTFSLSTEIIQHTFFKNRSGDLFDFLANALGIMIAYLILKKRIKS